MNRFLLPLLLTVSFVATANAATPADHAPAAFAVNGQNVLIVQRGRFHCAEGERRSVLVQPDGVWVGCVRELTDGLVVVFEDGDTLTVPRAMVRPASLRLQPGERAA